MHDTPIIKSGWEIDLMRQAGRIVATGLKKLQESVKAGMSTRDLDRLFEKHVRDSGATPTFLGYRGFPASLCVSLNEEIVHGIPSEKRIIKEGDVVSLDAGATYKGYIADSAVTVGVGKISDKARKLIDVTRESLEAAIRCVRPGGRLTEIGAAVQGIAEKHGYGIVRKYCGHGVGKDLHEAPQVPNYVEPGFDYVLKPGICIAIEPMLNEGTEDTRTLGDKWTVVTKDGKLSAHFEHSIAVTQDGHEVLTRA